MNAAASSPPRTLDSALDAFTEDDATVRLLWALFGAIPGAPPVSFYRSLDEARMLVFPELDDAAMVRAHALAAQPSTQKALTVADAIDTGDVGISVFTGVRSALTFFFGDRAKALDTDAQQGADAALKMVAIAWMAHTLIPGPVTEKVARLRALPSGEALLTYYAAVELALPFTDDILTGTGGLLSRLLERYGPATKARLDSAMGAGAEALANGMVSELVGPVDDMARSLSAHAQTIAAAAQQWLPPAIATAGTVAGAVATAADALPIYRLLGARLAAEVCLQEAARR
ncbi:MAG: hypothetical protein Q8P41_01230 [Pseudomonadota bacterium]|nr:hypothetical protein [Pseudomonadota bacterium]